MTSLQSMIRLSTFVKTSKLTSLLLDRHVLGKHSAGVRIVLAFLVLGGTVIAHAAPTTNHLKFSLKHNLTSAKSIDPADVVFFPQQCLLGNLAASLMRVDSAGQVRPRLARSWQVDREQSRITFTLDPARKFSDGSPITAEDVRVTFARACLKDSNTHFPISHYLRGCQNVDSLADSFPGVQIIDAARLALLFSGEIPDDILFRLAHKEFSILPRSAVDPTTLAIDWGVTSGDYTLKSISRERIELERNPFPSKNTGPQLVTITQHDTSLDALERVAKGKVDAALSAISPDAQLSKWTANGSIHLRNRQFVYLTFVALNPYSKPLADQTTRHKITSAFLQQARKVLHNDVYTPATSIFAPGLAGSFATDADRATPVTPHSYQGQPLRLAVIDAYNDILGSALSELIALANVPIHIDWTPRKDIRGKILAGDYDLLLLTSGTSARAPEAFFEFFLKLKVLHDPTGALKVIHDKMKGAIQPKQSHALIRRAEAQLMTDGTFVPLWHSKIPIILGRNTEIVDLPEYSEDIPFANFRITR